MMIHESSSSDEEVEEVKDDTNVNDQQSIRDRVANGEVPLDILERQRGHAPPGAYVLTDQESQREIANSILFAFMDVLAVGAWLVCLVQGTGDCQKPLTAWYSINGLWALGSLVFMAYYSFIQLKNNYQTKKCIWVTYGIEAGYLILSIWAWVILAKDDVNGQC